MSFLMIFVSTAWGTYDLYAARVEGGYRIVWSLIALTWATAACLLVANKARARNREDKTR